MDYYERFFGQGHVKSGRNLVFLYRKKKRLYCQYEIINLWYFLGIPYSTYLMIVVRRHEKEFVSSSSSVNLSL